MYDLWTSMQHSIYRFTMSGPRRAATPKRFPEENMPRPRCVRTDRFLEEVRPGHSGLGSETVPKQTAPRATARSVSGRALGGLGCF